MRSNKAKLYYRSNYIHHESKNWIFILHSSRFTWVFRWCMVYNKQLSPRFKRHYRLLSKGQIQVSQPRPRPGGSQGGQSELPMNTRLKAEPKKKGQIYNLSSNIFWGVRKTHIHQNSCSTVKSFEGKTPPTLNTQCQKKLFMPQGAPTFKGWSTWTSGSKASPSKTSGPSSGAWIAIFWWEEVG